MNSQITSVVMMLGLFAIMYFLLIRPQSKKDKEDKKMRDNLSLGDEIVTIGGIYGKVVRLKDDRIVISTSSEKIKIEIARNAVSAIVDPEAAKAAKEEKEAEKPGKFKTKNMKKLGEKTAPAEEAAPAETPAVPAEAPAQPEAKTEE